MTNEDLKAKSEEYIELGERLTETPEYGFTVHNGRICHVMEIDCEEQKITKVARPNEHDIEAMSGVGSMIDHIAQLQKVIDEYEDRIERLVKKHNRQNFEFGMIQQILESNYEGLSESLKTMTEGK